MNSKTILIIDDKPKNIEVLVSGLVNSHFQVVTTTSGFNGLEKARKVIPDLILMDTELPDLSGIEFTQKLKEDSQLSTIPVILLSTREGIQDRLKAYEAGVKDYIIKPLHVSEIITRVNMILSRIERRIREHDTKVGKLIGNLKEKPLAELIEEFSLNKATGILTITNFTGKSGQLFFRDGRVVNAIVGNFRGERAVYQMIPWGMGKYTMIFQDIDIKDVVSVSNLGLLLQAKKQLEKRVELLKSLPNLSTKFTLSSTFLHIIEKRQMSSDVVRFVQLFNGQNNLQQIIDESFYDDIVTLERTQKMYLQGFLSEVVHDIKPESKTEGPKKPRMPMFTEEECKTFQTRAMNPFNHRKRVLLLLGDSASGKNEIIQLLVGPTYQAKTMKNQFPHSVNFGKVPISKQIDLTLIGIPIEKNLHLFVDSFEEFMLGYIILINAKEPETFEYMGYLIKTFRNRYQLPYTLAVTQSDHPKATDIESLTVQLGLENYEDLMIGKPADLDNVKTILLNMNISPASGGKVKAQIKVRSAN